MPLKDAEARREYRASYYQRNRKKRIADAIAWGKANPEKKKKHRDKWRANNREKVLFQRCKDNAKYKGLEFDLELSDIVIPGVCPILGIPLKWGGLYTPSVDRIYNNIGYVKGNIVVISWRANQIKRAATIAEIQALAAFYAKYDW